MDTSKKASGSASNPADEPTIMGGKFNPPEAEPVESDDRTYVYKPSEIAAAANRSRPSTAGLVALIDPAIVAQDLTRDKLLEEVPRIEVDGKTVPALGGIPLFGKLGQGAMGAVYYGIDPKLRSGVAIKVFPVAMTGKEVIDRLYEQVHHIAKLKSKYLVSCRTIDKEGGLCYIVLEYVSGISAAGYAQRIRGTTGKEGIPEAVALDLCIAATDGLAAAHRDGIMHGDIRPQNILIPRKGSDVFLFAESKLTDMGIPRIEELGGLLSGANAPMGQPGFMAPEQAVDAKASRKPSDVFSMGATLYALLTGKPPFDADNPMNAILASIQTQHEPVSKLRKDVSPATSEVIDRCLAKQPGDRFADGSALLEALSVCRVALSGAKVTQPSAIKKVTMVLEKAEVGKKVIGTSDSHTPSKIDFAAAIGVDPGASGVSAKAGTKVVEKRPSATGGPQAKISGERAAVSGGRPGTAIQKRGGTGVVPPAPAAASGVAQAAPPAPSLGLGAVVKILIAMVGVLLLAIVAMVVFRQKSEAPDARLSQTHAALLQKAKERVKDDPSFARTFLDSAKDMALSDKLAREEEAGVTALIEAYELFNAGKDVSEIESALARAEKILPTEPAISRLRGRIDEKQKK